MGINFDGMNPEQKANLNRVLSDGKVTKSEFDGLSAAEQEALSTALGGKVPSENIELHVKITKKPVDAPKQEPQEEKAWYEKAWDTVKAPLAVVSGFAAAGAATGAGIGAAGGTVAFPGLGTAAGAGAGALAGAAWGVVAGLGSMFLASCSTDEPELIKTEQKEPPKVEINVNQTVNLKLDINVDRSDKENIAAILNFIQEFGSDIKNCFEEVLKKMEAIGMSIDQISNILTSMAGDNQELKALLNQVLNEVKEGNSIGENNNKVLNQILAKMGSIENSNADVKALLQTIIGKININNDLTAKQSQVLLAILDSINKLDSKVAQKLDVILDKLNNMGDMNIDILTKILNKVSETKDEKDYTAILDAILTEIQKNTQQNKDMDTKTHQLLTDILNSIGNFENSMKDAIAAVIAKIGDVSVMTNENKALLEAILAKMDKMDKANQNNFAAILKAIAEGNQINAEGVKVLTAILNKLDKMDASTQANFKSVIDMLTKGNNINTEILAKMNQVLAKMDKMDANQANFFTQILAKFDQLDPGYAEYFKQILDKLDTIGSTQIEFFNNLLAKLDKIGPDYSDYFKQILSKFDKLSAEQADFYNKILAKLDNVSGDQKEFFAQILAKFDGLEAGQQQSLDKILDAINDNTAAINKNTTVAKATYDLVAKLLDKIDELKNNSNVNVSAILDAIANISTGGGNVDLSTVEKLLADLLKSSDANNKVLTNIEAKLEAVSVTLGGIKVLIEKLGDGQEKSLDLLQKILDKIPNGCKCDITVIVGKLDEIIESLKKGDGKHEGILDDLDDYFN